MPGRVHIHGVDVKYLPPAQPSARYAYFASIAPHALSISNFLPTPVRTGGRLLDRFLPSSRSRSIRIRTDNGSEFTDLFAVRQERQPQRQALGRAFPSTAPCAGNAIAHRLTLLSRPQTNACSRASTPSLAEAPRPRAANRAAHLAALSPMPNAMPILPPSSPSTIAPAASPPSLPRSPPSSSPTRGRQQTQGRGEARSRLRPVP